MHVASYDQDGAVQTVARPWPRSRAAPGAVSVAITDILMPGMTGVEVARELDAMAPGARILFMSGYAAEGAAILASRPGSRFLAKPFTLPELAAEVRALMDGGGRAVVDC